MNTPPPGNQNPYGNQPQYTQPGGYVPPPQQRQSSNGCWLWGGLGCLVLFLVFGGIIGWIGYSASHGKGPIGSSMGSIMSSAKKMEDTTIKAKAVIAALGRYKADNGHYPNALTDLIPKYLPDASALHSPSDPNTDPAHISFDYTKPANNAPGDTVLISFHSPMDMNMMGMSSKIDQKVNNEINGNETIDTTTTTTTPDGKTITQTQHMDMATGKTTRGTGAPSSTNP